MYHGKPAKKEGLGAIFLGNISLKHLFLGSLLPLFLLGLYTFEVKRLMFVVYPVFLYLLAILIKEFCKKKFGGLTGDNLGATVELSEVMGLFLWGFYG